MFYSFFFFFFFFFNDTATTEIYSLPLHAPLPISPASTLTKPPSAELRPNQTDQDTLPPYDVLDRILKAYIEGRSEEHTSELRHGYISYAVFCLKKKKKKNNYNIKKNQKTYNQSWI